MPSRLRVFSSSVGTKILIGLTGLALFLFLISHVAGNLLFLLGPTIFNNYSHLLVSNPLVPAIEVGLALIFLVHAYKTVTMYLGNQRARPVAYARKERAGGPSRKTFSSTTMIFSGLWLLLFVIIHVKGFKYGPYYESATPGVRDLYRLELESFGNPLIAGFYLVSMLVVGSHLWHGIVSGFQSLGAPNPSNAPGALRTGKLVAALITGGFIVIILWAHFAGVRS